MKKLLELANAIEPDAAGLIHVAPINTQFRAGGEYSEYGAAVKAAVERACSNCTRLAAM